MLALNLTHMATFRGNLEMRSQLEVSHDLEQDRPLARECRKKADTWAASQWVRVLRVSRGPKSRRPPAEVLR